MDQSITNREEKLYRALKPVVEQLGVRLIDVELKTHEKQPVIRVVVYNEEGVGVEKCKLISDYVSPLIDLEMPDFNQSYNLEVSSPGLKRKLRRSAEYQIFMGHRVDVKCYMPVEGRKEWSGDLAGGDSEAVLLELEDQSVELPQEAVASVRLYFNADEALKSGRK